MGKFTCGVDFHHCNDLHTNIQTISEHRFDFLCIPLVHPRYEREFFVKPARDRDAPLTRSDLLLAGKDWSELVVGKISPWLDLDSKSDRVRMNSEKGLMEELNFCLHLAIPAVEITLRSGEVANLARSVYEHVSASVSAMTYWIRVPMQSSSYQLDDVIEGVTGENKTEEDTWHWWQKFRTLASSQKNLGVALELTADLPSPGALARWYAEPVKACYIPTSIFIRNQKGFPVLNKRHQEVVQALIKLSAQPIVTGVPLHGNGYRPYQQYLEHLFKTQDPLNTYDSFSQGYEDYLQSPLQPLMDNLDSSMYETFERDPIKYQLYEKAIYKALRDRIALKGRDTQIVLMVVGAGRGPLVKASLRAASNAGAELKVYAVEKNPNAVVTLRNLQLDEWGDKVTVVSCDMRDWESPVGCDILVSELLGSFGDNELSPECLYGVEQVLKEDGISIPSSYTSFLSPIMSAKLYNEARAIRETDKHPLHMLETPYVVRHQNCLLLGEPQEAFVFNHPKPADETSAERYKIFHFESEVDAVIHGFSGYFESVLYKDILMSIRPATHSPAMVSWFPVYFPIAEPVAVKKGDTIIMHLWRKTSTKKVWYEWAYTSPVVTAIHNPKGRSFTIGL